MNFDFDDDQRELQRAVRDLLADRSPLSRVREVFEGDEPYDARLWRAAVEMGWTGLTVPESHGGVGLGPLELCLVAEEVGRALAPIPLSSSTYVVTSALLSAGTTQQQAEYLPRLADGSLIGTFAVQEQATSLGVGDTRTSFADGTVTGVKVPVPDGDVAGLAIVVCDGGSTLALVLLDGRGVTRSAVESFDPSRSFASVAFENAPATVLGRAGAGRELLDHVYDQAAVYVAFEQIGGAQRCLDLAVEYAKARYTFGRPIGSYQSIKHKLADVFVAIELARSNAYYAAWALATGNGELPVAACLARISATEAFEMAAREGLHVHGGIGFTWEHDAHLFLRRSKVLATTLGTDRQWKQVLVDRLIKRNAG